MSKFLVCEKVEEAQDLLTEALTTRRKLKLGILIRYYFHAMGGHPPEAVLKQGVDRVAMLRTKEPRVFLERMKEWVFSRDCMLLPRDKRYAELEKQHEAKLNN
jgi:hypothetical protein